jgi:iron complex outermembrane receptor protein
MVSSGDMFNMKSTTEPKPFGNKLKLLLLINAILSTTMLPAFAADEDKKAEESIEVIMVTATKRTESLQDVPISMSVFNEEKIEALRPDDLTDLSSHVPNMYLPPANESATQAITMRGLGPGVQRSSGRSVGIYIDGVYTSADNLTNLPVSDLERIEILKGPQGTLFGRDTIGGAINVTTRKPDNEFSGFVEADIGNYGRQVFNTALSIPLMNDELAMRVSLKKLDYSGHIDNIYTGEKADGLDQLSGRVQLYYTPNDKTDVRVIYNHSERDDNPTTGENAAGFLSDEIPFLVNTNEKESFIQDADSLSLSVNYEFDSGFAFTSITGWAESDDKSFLDRDLTPLAHSTQSISYHVEDVTQEFRLISPESKTFDYIVGLYYLNSEVKNRDIYPLFGDAWLANIPFPSLGPDLLDGQERNFTATSTALFTNMNYHINEDLSLFGGLRYTSDKKEVSVVSFGEIYSAFGFLGTEGKVKTKDTPLSWSIGTRYSVSDALKTYASVSRGYRSAAVKDNFVTAADLIADNGFVTKPEFVTNYEIGAKFRSEDGKLQLNTALFYMGYTDIQVSISVPPLLFVQQLQNAAEAHIQGFEIDGSYSITENFQISGSAGYLKTEYDDFQPTPDIDLSGTGFGNAPDWTLDAAMDYQYPIADAGDLLFHLDYTTITTPDDFEPNRTALELKGFSTVNGFVAFNSDDNKWRLTLWVKNLLDDVDPTSTTIWGAGLGLNQHSVYIYQPPRTYGLSLKYNFD